MRSKKGNGMKKAINNPIALTPEEIKELMQAEVVLVPNTEKVAHWIVAPVAMKGKGKGVSRAAVICSNCKAEQNQEIKNYCANCGAKMK